MNSAGYGIKQVGAGGFKTMLAEKKSETPTS